MQTIADGQLPTSTATPLHTVSRGLGEAVTLTALNTSSSATETVEVFVTTLANGVARRVAKAVLLPNEQLFVVGQGLGKGDSVSASTTDAATVDYVLTASNGVPFDAFVLDTNGARKSVLAVNGTNLALTALNGAADAVPPHASATYVVTTAGVDAMTLAAPTATVDDGKVVTITIAGAHAHTLTTVALLNSGGANANVATFAAHPGASITLMAYQGLWNVLSANAVTFTS